MAKRSYRDLKQYAEIRQSTKQWNAKIADFGEMGTSSSIAEEMRRTHVGKEVRISLHQRKSLFIQEELGYYEKNKTGRFVQAGTADDM